ncbi:rhodanese-like domain-containing protein [bacterium]|nr:rhodanese-like domain-containing protein [bacterium]
MKKIMYLLAFTVYACTSSAQPGDLGFLNLSEATLPHITQITNPSMVDYSGFVQLTNEVDSFRQTRMVMADSFWAMAQDSNTIILDTRSKAMYDAKHVKGAVHLNFSDFSEEKLAKVIPDSNTRILIYCNNNFMNDNLFYVSKGPPLALNIPTFINLYGYGYKNIYELAQLIPLPSEVMPMEGTAVFTPNLEDPNPEVSPAENQD